MKSCRFFWPKAAALFAAIVLSSPVFAAQSLPDKMAALVQTVYETAQSNDGNWIFVNAESAADGKNRLYSFDNKSGEARVLFEPFPDTSLRFVYGIHFWPKTQKLYFMVHCGQYEKNGARNLFLHEGLYTAQMDSEQNYSARGVWRQSVLEGWLLKNLWTAYIQKAQGTSDYKEFLSALCAFADPGTNPVFALPAKNGAALYGTDALEWMVQNKKEKEFLEQAEGALVFPLEKYLLCRDDGGNVLQKSAVTTRERNLNNKNAGMIWTETTFAEANQNLYCVLMKGSFKNENLPTQEWTWDYSLVFEIQDDQSGISFFVPEPLKDIRAATYPFGASDQPPIQGTKDGLLIRDINGKTKWLYDGNNAARHSKLRLGAAALKSGSAAAWLWLVCAGLGLALLLLLILFCQFSRGRFSFSWQRKIVYRIQEEERNKISRDIHDSIVQDIRAIRIEAEMLKLAAGEEQKQKDLTAKITD
ncbi:MAG: histidine kinase dimerization/phosphoacceptor domain-containing protein, partial [Treponema sp.]|nr:histidine kinase dimerization/phosphoacceptor domain-containing protein [Treponema sp.]